MDIGFFTTTPGVTLIGSVCLLAGAVAGAVINSLATRSTARDRVTADREIADRKTVADLELADRKMRAENARLDRDRRIAHYQAIQDSLPGLTVAEANRIQVNGLLAEVRRLWLVAPPGVVVAMNNFVDAIAEKQDNSVLEQRLGEMIIAFRSDLLSDESAQSALPPALTEASFRVRSAV